MQIHFKLRIVSRGLADRLAAHPLLAKALKPRPDPAAGFLFPETFDAAGPVLTRVLELADGERLSLFRDMSFPQAELQQASHLEVKCKVTIAQTRPTSEQPTPRTRGKTCTPRPAAGRCGCRSASS